MNRAQPDIEIVNGYEILEYPEGHFTVMTSEGPVTNVKFPTFAGAADYAKTLAPGARRRP